MLNNKQRRELLTRANEAEFPGSILDVFRGAEQGRDLINEFKMSQGDQMAVASTPEEQNRGLRPFHNAGRTDMSMTFTDVPPNTPFNTVGMKKPIDIKTYDRQGHLVKSYDAVPPGMTGLSSGPNSAYAVERPAKAQSSISPITAPVDNTSTAGVLPTLMDEATRRNLEIVAQRREALERPVRDENFGALDRTGITGDKIRAMEENQTVAQAMYLQSLLRQNPVILRDKDDYTGGIDTRPVASPEETADIIRLINRDPEYIEGIDKILATKGMRPTHGAQVLGRMALGEGLALGADLRGLVTDWQGPTWQDITGGDNTMHTNPGPVGAEQRIYTTSTMTPSTITTELGHARLLNEFIDYYGSEELGKRYYNAKVISDIMMAGGDQSATYHIPGMLEYYVHNDPNNPTGEVAMETVYSGHSGRGTETRPKRMGLDVNMKKFREEREKKARQQELDEAPMGSPLFFGAFPKEEPKAQSEKVKGQSSVSPINYLLDTLVQPDPVGYANRQTMRASDALKAETERVADVRANVLTQAQNIEQGQAELTDEAREAYRFYQDTSYDMSGETPQAIRAELMRRQELLPDSVKEVLPDEGRYNVFNVSPTMYGTGRQLYCTPYGCLPYRKAGAGDLPIVHSNPKFRAGARSGSIPFQPISASERQPGDIALQVGMAPADYGQSSGPRVLRPHHTTIYSGEAEGTTDFNDPESIMAYNARGGVAMRFGESEIDREDAPLEFYRYVGQTPQMQQALDARQIVSRAMPLPTVEPLGVRPIPTSRPAQQLQTRTTSPEVLAAARRRRRPRFRRV